MPFCFGVLSVAQAQQENAPQPQAAGTENPAPQAAVPEQKGYEESLQEAYRKEFAFLSGQKRELQRRIEDFESRTQREQAQVQGRISALESRILGLDSTIQDVTQKVNDADRAAQSSSDEKQLIEATLDQARVSLRDYDVNLADFEGDEPSPEYITKVFSSAIETLGQLSSIYQKEGGEFFLADGTKVEGTVTHLGRIAAFGVSDRGGGALAPAGGGKLKVWRESDLSDAEGIANAQPPKTLNVFLYESLDRRVDEEAEETVYKHINDGGMIAWVIVSLGLLGVLLAIIRALLLSQASGGAGKVEKAVEGMVREGRYGDAANKARSMRGSAARVVASVFSSLRDGTDKADEAISEAMLGESRNIQRFGVVILVIAAVSPLLGLLGTVTGMISTFDVITKFGTGDPKLLSGGISTALITTELGLIVAIPTLLLGNLLKSWADGIESEAEQAALRLVTLAPDVESSPTVSGVSGSPIPAPNN